MKVLIIDDSIAARFMLAKMFKELGCDVVEAEDGKVALEVLKSNLDTNLALVDWNMPVMDGLEFVKCVRADSSANGLKLMMVTTETEMDRVIEALNAGANEYLMKPFNKEMVSEKLKHMGVVW